VREGFARIGDLTRHADAERRLIDEFAALARTLGFASRRAVFATDDAHLDAALRAEILRRWEDAHLDCLAPRDHLRARANDEIYGQKLQLFGQLGLPPGSPTGAGTC
jgi:hypothetical protein